MSEADQIVAEIQQLGKEMAEVSLQRRQLEEKQRQILYEIFRLEQRLTDLKDKVK